MVAVMNMAAAVHMGAVRAIDKRVWMGITVRLATKQHGAGISIDKVLRCCAKVSLAPVA